MSEAVVIRRRLQAEAQAPEGGPRLLDAVSFAEVTPEGTRRIGLRLFFAARCSAAAVLAEQPEGCVSVSERREVANGLFVIAHAPEGSAAPLQIAVCDLPAAPEMPESDEDQEDGAGWPSAVADGQPAPSS
ncbi:MAG: hypothetical protein IE922_14020, partial [Sphingomonadales bacterium]|nr:hypothetical protein [Sphingomonadales bacterium]